MKIERIELFHVAIPLPEPFYPAWIPGYPQTVNRFTLMRLTTDDGLQGLAAGVAFERIEAPFGTSRYLTAAEQIQGQLSLFIHPPTHDLQVVIPDHILEGDIEQSEVAGVCQTLPGSGVGGPHRIVVDHGDLQRYLRILLLPEQEDLFVVGIMNIVGAGAEVTTVEASDPNDHVFHVDANNVNITGFTVKDSYGAGVWLDNCARARR